MSGRIAPEELRSHQWYGTDGLRSFSHRARTRQLGYLPEEHLGKPVVAILNTWSDINPCHVHLRERAQAVKRGVWQAGGFPLEFPVSTLSETFQKPTPMLYRNMLAMETEELLRSYPVDGAVLLGGCDKSTPALLMGAASVDLPTVFVPAGPMLPGHWRDEVLGSGTDMWKYWDDKRAGLIGDCEMAELESGLARSPGHCMTMGTASTLTAAAEALGVTVPGASSIPAVDSGHDRMAARSGLRIVELVWQQRKLSQILTPEAYEDAVATVLALGGSTNAVIHLIAMAGRSGVRLTLDDFDRIARTVPVLANLRPGGKYLMEDFHFAGGLPGFLARLTDVLHLDRPTVAHDTLREQLDGALVHNADVIRDRDDPLAEEGAWPYCAATSARTGRSSSTSPPSRVCCGTPARGRLRRLPRDAAHHQRPGPGADGGPCPGAAQRGTQGRARDARVRHAADPRLPAQAGCTGHGADLRRPDERHQLRGVRPAHRAGVVRRRPPRPRPHR